MAKNATIHTQVHIGQPEGMDGYGLQVDIQVEGVEDSELIQAGHKVSGPPMSVDAADSRRSPQAILFNVTSGLP